MTSLLAVWTATPPLKSTRNGNEWIECYASPELNICFIALVPLRYMQFSVPLEIVVIVVVLRFIQRTTGSGSDMVWFGPHSPLLYVNAALAIVIIGQCRTVMTVHISVVGEYREI